MEKHVETTTQRGYVHPFPGPVVDTAWLAAELGASDLLVCDASVYLPNEGIDALARYRTAHLPGALYFDIEAFSAQDTPLPHMAPAPADFERLAADIGLGAATRVVFYDQRGLFSAARGWWLLRYFGHDAVAVLDGGLPAWQREGRPTESGDAAAPPPAAGGPFVARVQPALLRDRAAMLRNVDSGAERMIDARPGARFSGAQPEPRPGVRSGHIPGARSLPLPAILEPDGRLLPREALRQRFAAAGVDGTRPVVASCGSGVTAAGLLLGLAVAGLPDGALYDGSWSEWGARADTPVAVD